MTTFAGQYGPEPVFDSAGKLLKNASVSVFNTGTTTLATLYTDRTRSTPAANPTTSDAVGNLTFFAAPGDYSVVVNEATLTLQVPLDPADAVSGSGSVTNVSSANANITVTSPTTTPVLALVLDSSAGDIAGLGSVSAGATGKPADAGHVHPTTNLLTASTGWSGDLTGTGSAPTLKTTGPGATGPLGSATAVPTVTIDANGRVTALTSTSIAIPESAVTSLATDLGLKALLTETVEVANSGTTLTLADYPTTLHLVTLTGNVTFTFPAAVAGKSFLLQTKQDGSGSRTIVWPGAGSLIWVAGTPTPTSTLNKSDLWSFVCLDGSHYLGIVVAQNF